MRHLAIVAAFIAAPALSGPDETTSYFQDPPATLHDLGILRVELRLQGVVDGAKVGYLWDADEYHIIISRYRVDKTEREAHKNCKLDINAIRKSAGIMADGKLYSWLDHSTFADAFAHNGFVRRPQEAHQKRLSEMDKKFVIRCASEYPLVEADLIGTGYRVSVD